MRANLNGTPLHTKNDGPAPFCKHFRYLRVRTTPPDTIRYGRSPAAPAPPSPTPARAAHQPSGARRRPLRTRVQNRRNEPAAARRGRRVDSDDDNLDTRNGGHRGHRTPGASASSSCSSRSSSGGGGGRRRRKRRLSGDGNDAERRKQENGEEEEEVDGYLEESASHRRDCPPPMAWDELEPWEQRNPRTPWMMSPSRGGRRDRRRRVLRSGAATPKESLVALHDKVRLREVWTGKRGGEVRSVAPFCPRRASLGEGNV